MEILVILPNNLGDIIMTTPALAGLRIKFPGAQIIFFAEKGFEAGIVNNPDIDNIYLFDRKRMKEIILKGNSEEILIEFRRAFSDFEKITFDYIFNFSQHEYISYLATWLKSKKVLGRFFNRGGNHSIDDKWSRYLYAIPFARKFNMLHASDVYRRIAEVENQTSFSSINFTEDELNKSAEYLEKTGVDLDGGEIVFFQPGAAFSTKRWPESYYVKLGKMLVKKNIQIVVSGALPEKENAEKIAIEIGDGAFCTAGETSFREAMVNLNFADALVTGDTALMHAAAGLNVRTFAIFGSTNPVETGPYGESHFIFTSKKCNEFPCFKNSCDHMTCMKSITPDDLFAVMKGKEEKVKESNVYESSFTALGDYRLAKVNGSASNLFSTSEAHFVKSLLDGTLRSKKYTELLLVDNRVVADIVADMVKLLKKYLEKGDVKFISAFEQRKKDIEDVGGISLLWGAYLNLALNSIPLIDPISAIEQSIDVCESFSKMLTVR